MAEPHPLESALDDALAVLSRGDLSQLPRVTAQLAALLEGLEAPDTALLHRLRLKADRNRACLLGARRGLRAARRRLAELRAQTNGGGSLVTYDGTGRLQTQTDPGAIIQRL